MLTQEALDKLLACLDSNRERAGEKYEQIHGGLVKFFEWRGCSFSQDHADETINRVARKLDQGEELRDVYSYVYGVARMLVLEIQKESAKQRAAFAQLPTRAVTDEIDELEPRAECLKQCLASLPSSNRDLIMRYYQGEKRTKIENRRRLAQALDVSLDILRIRAFRLREKLAGCMDDCLMRDKNLK
jgi:DNA-directed RNA polymerase specialized sigma24 family protein